MLITAASMREYFHEALTDARRRTRVSVSEDAQAYLVELLAEFARAENAFAGTDRGERPTLALLLGRAQDADPSEALRIYKHMGDSSLYLTGFFGESVERDLVGVDYYVQMGGSAYASVAGLMRTSAATSSALFAELSDRFGALVELLAQVSLLSDAPTDGSSTSDVKVLKLLERYRRTGRPELLEKLEQAGVVLRPGMRNADDDLVH